MVRLNVHFLRKQVPTASLAEWAHVVDDGVMQHDVLLGRDSWMRFDYRSYRTLPSRRSNDEAMGELTLAHHKNEGATAFFCARYCGCHQKYQLRYAGQWPIQLRYAGQWPIQVRPEHQMVQVEFVRRDGSPALVGHYLVDMLPQASMFCSEGQVVKSGCQRVSRAGVSFPQPGDVLGVAPAPLLRVPLSANPRDDPNDDLQADLDSSDSFATGADGSVSSRAEAFVHNLHERSTATRDPEMFPTLRPPFFVAPARSSRVFDPRTT